MKIKIQGWPLYVLVLTLQQLMTLFIFFPADSHLHFPVYCVVSRPFQRKATRDSSDDIFSLYSHCVERKPLKIAFNSSPRTKFWETLLSKAVCSVLTKNSQKYFCFALFWRENFGLARACKKRRAHVSKTITMTIFSLNRLVHAFCFYKKQSCKKRPIKLFNHKKPWPIEVFNHKKRCFNKYGMNY